LTSKVSLLQKRRLFHIWALLDLTQQSDYSLYLALQVFLKQLK